MTRLSGQAGALLDTVDWLDVILEDKDAARIPAGLNDRAETLLRHANVLLTDLAGELEAALMKLAPRGPGQGKGRP